MYGIFWGQFFAQMGVGVVRPCLTKEALKITKNVISLNEETTEMPAVSFVWLQCFTGDMQGSSLE